jgi:cardiolipin synthase
VPSVTVLVVAALELAVLARVLLRPHRDPAARIAWVAVILALPIAGIVAYVFLGEVNIGRRRLEKLREVERLAPQPAPSPPNEVSNLSCEVPDRSEHLWRVGRSISGFEPVGGNSGRLLKDSNAAIEAMVADIDAAKKTAHVLFYIWLDDGNGRKIASALERAAARGVACRAMVDGLGSRALLKSGLWRSLRAAGVKTGVALAMSHPLLRAPFRRVDLRNHRKIAVIDNAVTYCGSQNCADPEFRVKAKFAPWVDALVRFEGPIAQQNQRLFAVDWMCATGENLGDLLREPLRAPKAGFTAQVVGTGPTKRYSAMPELFEAAMYAARRELIITTPYFVPDESLQNALCSSAYRGVETTIVFPARNDSWIVAGASRSYYADLLAAGVRIHEYVGGLLHTKSMTIDGEIALIGSANMDRRSFDLNYENNILCYDAALTQAMRARQMDYLASARPISLEMVQAWSLPRRAWNNALAMLGPVL